MKRIPDEVRKVARRSMKRIPDQVRKGMLFRADLVELIRHNPHTSQIALARRLGVNRSTICKHITRLEEIRVIERFQHQFFVRTDEA